MDLTLRADLHYLQGGQHLQDGTANTEQGNAA